MCFMYSFDPTGHTHDLVFVLFRKSRKAAAIVDPCEVLNWMWFGRCERRKRTVEIKTLYIQAAPYARAIA